MPSEQAVFVAKIREQIRILRDREYAYDELRVYVCGIIDPWKFGRGGAGGVGNRVEKEARFVPLREVTLQGGTYGNKRFATDLDHPLNDSVAIRLNAMFEDADSFRHAVSLRHYGVTPTLTFRPSARS